MLVRQLQHSAKESIPYNEVDKLSVLILEVRVLSWLDPWAVERTEEVGSLDGGQSDPARMI